MGDFVLIVYVPNILSIIRIILIPFYIYYFLAGDYILAAIIFSLSALTDFFDGYLARKYDMTTDLGRILDPLADKITVISILLALVLANVIPKFIAIILLTREFFILISSAISFFSGLDIIHPSFLGKVSIFILYVAIALRLLRVNYIDMALFYLVIPLNLYSGFGYVYKAYKEITK